MSHPAPPRMSRLAIMYCLSLLAVLFAVILFVAWKLSSPLIFVFMVVVGMVALSPIAAAAFTHRALPDEDE